MEQEKDILKKLQDFGEDTLKQLRHNMKTQQVWPKEVYPRYKEINEIRRKYGGWYSTGDSMESLIYKIRNTRLDSARIDFFFNEYLRYVDIGVGKGRHADDIERGRKARYMNRYDKWHVQGRHTHRPAFMMEFRHLQQRIGMYMSEKYGGMGRTYIMEGMADILKDFDKND